MQRIGLNRVDFPIRPPAPEDFGRSPEQQAAQQWHGEGQEGIERQPSRQPLAGLQMKEDRMQQIDQIAHRGDHQAGDGADQGRQCDKARFPRTNEGAQAPGYLESVGHFSNQDASAIVRVLSTGGHAKFYFSLQP